MGHVMHDRVADEIRRSCRGTVLEAAAELAPFGRDFGGFVRRQPRLVCRPIDAADLGAVLRVAVRNEVAVSLRGSGHSQAGQCLGTGVVLDLKGIGGPPRIDVESQTMEIGAGWTWHRALEAALESGSIPVGLTHALDTTVAGTLSVAGVGAETHRVGPQVDNVLWVDVVTLDGSVVRVEASRHRELFDAVRGGFGQCGVMVRVGYPMRSAGTRLQTNGFIYADPAAFVSDVHAACAPDAPPRFVSGALVRSPLERARWAMLLLIGRDFDDGNDLERFPLPDLHADVTLPPVESGIWMGAGNQPHPFFRLFDDSVDEDQQRLAPWVEHVFSPTAALEVVTTICTHPPVALEHGPLGFIFIRRGREPAPLFRVPAGEGLLWGVGMFANFAESEHAKAREIMAAYSNVMESFGGTRYLSGFEPFGAASCAEHYGPAWEPLHRAKRRFDPSRTLSPGFIDWFK